MKAAVRPATTVRVWSVLLEPDAFVTVKVTVYDPAVVKAWLGFCAVLVPESPKFHCQEVGEPTDASVNCTTCPAAGEAGL